MQSRLTAGVTDLDTGLTDVDGDDFTHFGTELRASESRQLQWQQQPAMDPLGAMRVKEEGRQRQRTTREVGD